MKISFSDIGIFITNNDNLREVALSDISQIDVYKRDLMTFDELVAEITYHDRVLVLTEDNEGWEAFTTKVEQFLPGIPHNWYEDLVKPAFSLNLATIYRGG